MATDDSKRIAPSLPDEDESRKKNRQQGLSPEMPSELASVDFGEPIAWGKCPPYSEGQSLSLVPEGSPPSFSNESPSLCHQIHAISLRARACTMHLQPQKGQSSSAPVPTPIFMPVGTKGCLKGVTLDELTTDPALSCPIILANTYHLAIQPGTELVDSMSGLHAFQGNVDKSYNLLTDSGGFQMVSLVNLSEVSEDGVQFENPYNKNELLLLRPEDSIRHQNNISANIIMALDDVVSSVQVDDQRFLTATYRTLRWYDRCYKSHAKSDTQALFPILQGGLDTKLGGLRELCLAGFRHRDTTLDYQIPGFAIGGLAGGEEKDQFWRVVDQACRALPDDRPRYLMGVGYPLDLVVCVGLGIDMFDCVYPTRVARFGTCLVPGPSPGTLKLKSHECASSNEVIQAQCPCQACRDGISRARLHTLLKANNPVAIELVTQHNIAYMMTLVRDMRQSILDDRFGTFATDFVNDQFPNRKDLPKWVEEALTAAGVTL
jgi:tRNA-guanine transglycosylase